MHPSQHRFRARQKSFLNQWFTFRVWVFCASVAELLVPNWQLLAVRVACPAAMSLTPPAELLSYLDSLSAPHILFDHRYRILAANTAYRRQFGGAASVIGRTCYEVSHRFDRPCDESGESCPMSRARHSGQRERVLHLHHTPQGEAYVNIELVPLLNAQGQQVFFVEKMEEMPEAKGKAHDQGLVGRAPAFRQMLELVSRVGPSQAAVLLLGESGSGKELVARAVHDASARAKGPLVVVECASLTESLFESELFGHEKGAFTGAGAPKVGLVEAASGGTLFLDEVGDIPLPMQVKLLRLLETGTYRRVGSTELRRADIRVVSATHRDLQARVAEGTFREDLLHRISVFPIRLPALRERMEDLPLLVRSLLGRVAPSRGLVVSPEGLTMLMRHPFRGNVRELRNVLERLSLLCDGEVIEAAHVTLALNTGMPGLAPPDDAPGNRGGTLKAHEQQLLLETLRTHTGTRAELATRLGLSERSLYRRLRALGLT
jgi:two-component system, NtrC family, response regulator HydG